MMFGSDQVLILALESSAKPASVAVCSDGELLGQYFQNSGLTHSRTLLAMAQSLLMNLDIDTADIGLVAVARGPGSFTGVRIGVSAAKGIAWGADIRVCGVSTIEAMAYQTPEQGVIICPLMDARRNQFYNAMFEWRGGAPKRLCEDRAIAIEALETELISLGMPCLLVGDGAAKCHEYLEPKGVPCRLAPAIMRFQTAYGVALAAANTTPIPATELEPCYLRPSQAEREKEERRSERANIG